MTVADACCQSLWEEGGGEEYLPHEGLRPRIGRR